MKDTYVKQLNINIDKVYIFRDNIGCDHMILFKDINIG